MDSSARQYNRILSCFSFQRYRSPCTSHVGSCKALQLASEFLTSYERFYMMSLNSSSSSSMKKIPRNFLALSSIGFSTAHFCFALRFDASDICSHISCQTLSGLEVVCFRVSLPPLPDKVHPSSGLNLVKPVHQPRSRNLQYVFPTIHPMTYVLFW